jgi:hypothetical protein
MRFLASVSPGGRVHIEPGVLAVISRRIFAAILQQEAQPSLADADTKIAVREL